MKFKDKTELLTVLDLVKPSVSTKDFDSMLKCYHFTENGIEGYNGEIYIKALYNIEGDFLVPADSFYKLISAIPSNTEFDIIADKDNIKVKVGNRIKAKFPLIAEFKFPCKTTVDLKGAGDIKGTSFPLNKEILEGLKICLEFIGRDETKPVYRGVYINPKGIYATDGYRIAHYNTTFDGTVFLPEAFCLLLLKHKPEKFGQDESKSAFAFTTPEALVFSNVLDLGEALPNYSGVIEFAKKNSKNRFITVTGDMVDTCKRVSVFAEGLTDKYCGLLFDEKSVTITVKNSNIGEIVEKFEISKMPYTGEEITVDLLLFQSVLEHSNIIELSPESELMPFPVIRGVNDNLEIVQITLNIGE